MDGMLLVDKPSGWTSFDVVNFVRRTIALSLNKKPKQIKVGHCGTLDPLACGLLILLIGTYTKRAGELSGMDKSYVFNLRLGQVSTTGDDEGEKITVSNLVPAKKDIQASLLEHIGTITQVPPIYSAIKIDGQRAYDLARRGKPVTMKPRSITVINLKLLKYSYPDLELSADVSSGTYIRSLAEDIGKYLGCGAYVTYLKRVKIGSYCVDDAVPPSGLTAQKIYDRLQSM